VITSQSETEVALDKLRYGVFDVQHIVWPLQQFGRNSTDSAYTQTLLIHSEVS